jgi:hypothetical protein
VDQDGSAVGIGDSHRTLLRISRSDTDIDETL